MSKKGDYTVSDYIDFDYAVKTFRNLNNTGDVFGLYGLVSIYFGMRVGDVRKLTFEDLRETHITVKEEKTDKVRKIETARIQDALTYHKGKTGLAFKSQKGKVFTNQRLNVKLKELFKNEIDKGCNISTHSLRKTFGRQVWKKNNESEASLILLSDIFNHSSIGLTRRYLGITKDEITNIYLNL